MSKGTFKAIFPIIFLTCILLILFIGDQNDSRALWKAVKRRDSYNNELQYYSKDNIVIELEATTIPSCLNSCDDIVFITAIYLDKLLMYN